MQDDEWILRTYIISLLKNTNIHKAFKGKNKYNLFGTFISLCEGSITLEACMLAVNI